MINGILPILLKLLSKNDEYFLMILFNDYLFNKSFTKDKVLKEDLVILQQMYLGYCLSDNQTYKVSEPNYKMIKSDGIIVNSLIHEPDMKNEIMLPLLDDWVIKPLFYITKKEDSNLQNLVNTNFVN